MGEGASGEEKGPVSERESVGKRGEIVGGLGNSIGGIRRLTRRKKEDEEEGEDLKRGMNVRREREMDREE